MTKCENCKEKEATCWYKKEHLCQSCYIKKKEKRVGNPTWLDKLLTKKR